MAKRAVYQIAEFKAAGDTSGEFTAVVSVFNNVDLVGDRVMPGAFKGTLDRWKTSGDPIPVIWSHDWQDPYAHIGTVTSAQETPAGLQVTGKLDLDKPFAKQVHDLLLARRVTGMSFAYDVIQESTAKDGANNLTELDLIEVGPTLKGANPDAHLIGAKALLDAAAAEAKGEAMEDETDAEAFIEGLRTATKAAEQFHADLDALLTIGQPSLAAELATPVKAGRRLSQSTVAEMQKIHDGMAVLQEQMKALMGSGTEEAPKSAAPDEQLPEPGERHQQIEEAATDTTGDREPSTAKSPPAEDLHLRSLVAEMRATMRNPSGSIST